MVIFNLALKLLLIFEFFLELKFFTSALIFQPFLSSFNTAVCIK